MAKRQCNIFKVQEMPVLKLQTLIDRFSNTKVYMLMAKPYI